jgi:hypothetical protein
MTRAQAASVLHPTVDPLANGYSSYCEEHYPIVYQVGSGLRKRHKDIRVADSVWTLESLFHEAVAELEAEGEEVL